MEVHEALCLHSWSPGSGGACLPYRRGIGSVGKYRMAMLFPIPTLVKVLAIKIKSVLGKVVTES